MSSPAPLCAPCRPLPRARCESHPPARAAEICAAIVAGAGCGLISACALPVSCASLVSGDVDGNFAALFTRVGKAHASKAGPFHALLCVGSFFGRKGKGELEEYISGAKQGQQAENTAQAESRRSSRMRVHPRACSPCSLRWV